MRALRGWIAALLLAACGAGLAEAQGRPDPAALQTAQREAMKALSFMDGAWRGSAWTFLPSGEKHTMVQTERVGLFLDGTIRVIEGRGYEADGRVGFNAFAVVSFDPAKKSYSLRSHAMGHAGDFALTPKLDGFEWEIPAGPATIRYTAVIKDGTWREVGERLVPGQAPVRFFEMELARLGNSDWPAAGAVAPK
jgi:hypothetical protein